MGFSVFINFGGDCAEALEFYTKAFNEDIHDKMTYGEAPQDSGYEIAEEDKHRVMYAGMNILGTEVMFMDMPSEEKFVRGGGMCPTLTFDSSEELIRVFDALKEGGTAMEEPAPTFYAKLYASVMDKFGVWWFLMKNAE